MMMLGIIIFAIILAEVLIIGVREDKK